MVLCIDHPCHERGDVAVVGGGAEQAGVELALRAARGRVGAHGEGARARELVQFFLFLVIAVDGGDRPVGVVVVVVRVGVAGVVADCRFLVDSLVRELRGQIGDGEAGRCEGSAVRAR